MPVISNTTNELTQLILERARSFAWDMRFKLGDDRGTYDLTGCTITLTVRQPPKQGTAIVLTKDATLVDAAAGNARLDLQALDLDLAPGIYPMSVTLLDADAFSATIVKGELQILANTDPLTANVHDTSSMEVLLKADSITVRVNHLKPPDLSIGIVDTAPVGTPPGASWRGSYPHYILDLLMPRGETGAAGAPGAPGADGVDGVDGAPGATWYTGVAVPNNALGRDGDFYIRSNGDYYYKIAGAWALQFSLKGPQGDQGPIGPQGIQGIQGIQGPIGPEGPQGPPGGSDAATATYINDAATPSATRAALDALYAKLADLNADIANLAAHIADVSTHGIASEIVGRTEAQVLTNKTIALGSNTVSGTKAQFNTAITDADMATLDGAETLTNKTFTLGANTLTGTMAQINAAITDGDLASLAGNETLTNKTIALGSNTVSGTKAQFNAAMTDADFATLDGAETLTNKTLTTPRIGEIKGNTSGLRVILVEDPASSANYWRAIAAIAGSAPSFGVGGTDANISLNIFTKGSGLVFLNGIAAVDVSSAQGLSNKTLNSPVIAGVGQKKFVVKGSDEPLASSAALQDDNELTVAIDTAGTYVIDLDLSLLSAVNNTGNFRCGATFPAATTSLMMVDGLTVGATSLSGSISRQLVAVTSGTDPGVGLGAVSAQAWAKIRFFFVFTAAGTFTFRWAQSVSSANATTVKAGSTLKLERVA